MSGRREKKKKAKRERRRLLKRKQKDAGLRGKGSGITPCPAEARVLAHDSKHIILHRVHLSTI